MVRYLGEAIESVLTQDYPNIEYIVRDGGSTDGTVELLERYRDKLRFVSAPDGGTAAAIRAGFAEARGEIFAYLNADDRYFPGAVRAAVEALRASPEVGAVYGEGEWIDEDGRELGRYPTGDFEPARFAEECFLCQPTVFFRRSAYEAVGGFNAGSKYTYDYEFWIRLSRMFTMERLPQSLAASRMHRETKTLGARRAVFEENFRLLRREFGYVPFSWVYSYTCYRFDGRDQFFEPLAPSLPKYAASLVVGLGQNWRRPVRYLRDWGRAMSWEGLKRRLRGSV